MAIAMSIIYGLIHVLWWPTSETQLNPDHSPSVSSTVCYDGDVEYSDVGYQPCVYDRRAD